MPLVTLGFLMAVSSFPSEELGWASGGGSALVVWGSSVVIGAISSFVSEELGWAPGGGNVLVVWGSSVVIGLRGSACAFSYCSKLRAGGSDFRI